MSLTLMTVSQAAGPILIAGILGQQAWRLRNNGLPWLRQFLNFATLASAGLFKLASNGRYFYAELFAFGVAALVTIGSLLVIRSKSRIV